MRTNIILDDHLIKECFKYTNETTKKGLIHQALEEFIRNHSRRNLRKIRGKIEFHNDYDYKALRNDSR